jgi:hypothetical protein
MRWRGDNLDPAVCSGDKLDKIRRILGAADQFRKIVMPITGIFVASALFGPGFRDETPLENDGGLSSERETRGLAILKLPH